MIKYKSRVRIRPDDPRIYEALNARNKDIIGEVIGLYEPPPFSHDKRTRFSVYLDVDYYSLFYEQEIEVLP